VSEAEHIAKALKGLRSGKGWVAHCPCPVHKNGDRNPSLSIGESDGKLLLKCHAGGTFDEVMDALRSRGIVDDTGSDAITLMLRRARAAKAAKAAKAEPITRTLEETFDMPESIVRPLHKGQREHIYTLADGTPVRKVVVAYNQDGTKRVLQYGRAGDGWDLKADKGPIVPYRLPRLLQYPKAAILIVEGEKDVETLEKLKHLATTNPMGAEKWVDELNQHFAKRDVILIPDNDVAGERHIIKVYSHLKGIAASIKVLRLPDLPEKGDVSDWLVAGHTNEELIELLNKAPDYVPEGQPDNEQPDKEQPDDESVVIQATPWKWIDPKDVSPRAFLYGTHYIRQFLSAGFGAPGCGKSTKRMVEAIAMASGHELLGIKPVKKLKVWYWNGEDPQEEIDRRFAAICKHYGIKPEEC